jgi:multiple sugar transport system permease protein
MRNSARGLFRSIARRRFYLSDDAFSLLLMAPLFLWVAFTMAYPLFYGIQLALSNQRLIGLPGEFIGLDNFKYIFDNSVFLSGIIKSLVWTFLTGTLWGALGIFVGIMLQRTTYGRGAMRVWILFPWIIPVIAAAILWKWLLSGTYGVVNYLLVKWGIVEVGLGFLSTPDSALESASVIGAWRGFPFLAIIVLAGLLSIPREEYEAARIDGAGFWQELRFITFPYMKPTLMVLFLVGYMWAFNNFDLLWLINQGGPAGATRTLPLLVYEWAFREYFLGRASAVGVFMLAVQALFMLAYMRASRGTVGIFAPMESEAQ